MTDVLGIVGSISSPSKTRTAVESVLEGDNQQDANVDLLHLGEYDIDTADERVLSDYDGDTATVLEAIVRSDAFVIGTPVYRGSYSGLLKNVFDMIPRGQWQADVAPLEGSAVALVATGATSHHYLIIDTALRPLMAFFGSYVVGGSYLHDGHFRGTDQGYTIIENQIQNRLEAVGSATTDLATAIEESESLSELGP